MARRSFIRGIVSAPPVVNPQNAFADATPARGQDRHLLSPPAAQYVRVDDKLIIDYISVGAFNGVTVNYRLMDTSGQIIEFQNVLALIGDSAVHTLTVNLNEGYLLGVTLNGGGAGLIFRGEAFFVVSIGRLIAPNTFLRGMTIISDYLCGMALLAWPGGVLRQPTDGAGWLRSILVNPPAAGADWSLALPANVRTRIRSVLATLTASSTVANRGAVFQVLSGGLPILSSSGSTNQIANQAQKYVWSPQNQGVPGLAGAYISQSMPPDAQVPALSVIGPVTTGIQVGDQWSAIQVILEQWFDV